MNWRVWAVALVSSITLPPYGNVSSLLDKDNPWHLFRSDDPVLTAVRATRLSPVDCESWLTSLVGDRRGIEPMKPATNEREQGWGPWLPLDSSELDAIQECDDFPCDVKLDRAETGEMKSTPKEGRSAKFLALVLNRAREYGKKGVVKPYEFPGGIADPWALFEARGLKSSLSRPEEKQLGLRLLDFKESRVRKIRQVLDRRAAISADHRQASVWVRAVYTDHYFDSWGEWANAECIPGKKEIIVTMALSLELDLLKKTDFFSSLGKGSMRESVRKLSMQYLDQWWLDLRAAAEKKSPKK